MSARFNTILIPVDFSVNTEIAIAKTLELIDDAAATIHLLHVRPRGLFHTVWQYITDHSTETSERVQNKLNELQARIRKMRPDIQVLYCVAETMRVDKAISQKAAQLNVNLIVIGKHSTNSLFSFSKTVISAQIAAATGIPVLTAKPGSLHSPVKTVVIPVGPKFPRKKLELLDAWKNKPGFRIRLVSCIHHEKNDTYSKESLMNTYHLLKANWPGPVDYEVLHGRNQAKVLLKYCSKVNADLLIVYPGAETKAGGLRNRHISDLLPSNSRTQVLAIQPA
jgi:nucleotide-binding universal stress UspA family protein